MKIQLTGDWNKLKRLREAPMLMRRAIDQALRKEAHFLRNKIVSGIVSQAPGGQPFKQLGPPTIQSRLMRSFSGTKALILRGELLQAVTVVVTMEGAFIGILRTARGSDGHSLMQIADINEHGRGPIRIKMTDKQRKFLFALYKQLEARMGTKYKSTTGGVSGDEITLFIPKRPFLHPVWVKYAIPMEVAQRFSDRVQKSFLSSLGIPV